MAIWILFVFGLILGSFLNVVSLRYNEKKFIFSTSIIGGRSRCPHCRKKLQPIELIPLASFFIQKGRCRSCKKRISLQYPIVEFISGIIVAAVPVFIRNRALFFFNNPYSGNFSENSFIILWTIFFLVLLLIALIDFRKMIIPNELNVILAIIGLGILSITFFYGVFGEFSGSFTAGYASLFGLRTNIFLNRFYGVLFPAAFLGVIIMITRGRAMGVGDLKMTAAMGVAFGWPDNFIILMFAFILGTLASIPLLIAKKTGMKRKIPFGPFIAASSALLFFFGPQIISGYFQIFGL